jgi:hypothetical protein
MNLVLLSGGVDSAACLAWAKNQQSTEVATLHVTFGQAAHNAEAQASLGIAAYFHVPHRQATVNNGSQYGPGEVRARNAFLLLLALVSFPRDKGAVTIGIHAGTGYGTATQPLSSSCRPHTTFTLAGLSVSLRHS